MGDISLPYKIPEKLKKVKIENTSTDTIAPVPRTYTQEEVDSIVQKRDQSNTQQNSSSGGDEDEFGLSPKLLKGLQSTVGVFNALKEFASSPLTRLIETRVGERAATIVDNAFGSPQHGGGDKKDLLEMFLNSQMAFGFGQGLGARGPEFVESLGKTLGKERIDKFADNMLDQYGKGRGGSGIGSGIPGAPPPGAEVKNDSSQREMLMTLDPNNPEHVSAYAESQGGIRIDVARKMLMIHQDDFIKQMQEQGLDISGFNAKSGNKAQSTSEASWAAQPDGAKRSQGNINKENEEMLRLKREQEEMLRMKREVDKQLEKVVSFKDIKSGSGGSGKGGEEVIEKVAEIPDRWDSNELSEAELESIANAEHERLLANIKNSTGAIKEDTDEIKPVETVVEAITETVVDTDDIIKPPTLYIQDNMKIDKVEIVGEDGKVLQNPPEVKIVAQTAMCPKCRKIKVLFETEKGKLCETCKNKRGL